MRRLLALLCAVAIIALPAVATPRALADDRAVTETSFTVTGTPESDGAAVRLDASLFTAAPGTAHPAVVLAHGFGGSKADSATLAQDLARDGYTVITYTARGFGASGGLIHLDDPAYEGRDVQRVIDYAATSPEVSRVGTDPVIAVAGASYGGAAAFLAGALDRRVDAIVPAFTWHSLEQSLVPQSAVTGTPTSAADVTPIDEVGVFKQRWASIFFGSGGGGGGADGCGRFTATLCRAFVATAESGRVDDSLSRLLDRSSLAPLLGRISAPTLIVQGESDTLFPLDQADANYRGLPAATPKAMRWVTGGHDAGIDLDELRPELEGWLDRHLRDQADAEVGPGFSVAVPETSLVRRDATRPPEVFTADRYPVGTLPRQELSLSGGSQRIANPPGGVPAALTSLPGSGSSLTAASSVAGYPLAVLPGQSATFTTAELDAVRLTGSAQVELTVTSSASSLTLFASLWDLGPDVETQGRTLPQTAVLPAGLVAPVRLTGLVPGQPRTVRVALPPVAHQVPTGHRLRVVVATTDQAYATPTAASTATVALAGDATLSLPQPVLASDASAQIDLNRPLAVVVAALAVAAVLALVALRRRRRAVAARPELATTPLVVEDLVKTYAEGVRAVDGVSFRAEPGQVVGLLGPNGAGKTTTLRMMVGLIRPDSGSVYVHGQPVGPGADVLAGVGAFIEGPGFLPHLSGLENLTAYWAATGRPPEDAQLERALDIAGLGSAVHRRVRGYSQGMRQRLGIAQAMLGLPGLLLLDEPTNGLDPPQIKAMRTVLADYAATGRTVVVSSHLLAEVELSCSHVVMMNRGRVVLTGAMAELTTTEGASVIGLAEGSDLDAAAAALRPLEVTVADSRLRVVGGDRAASVERLVRAGFAVRSVDGRRHLEEVFMSLVGGEPTPSAAARSEEAGRG